MDVMNNIVCPVCTLFLRPGITLENHLTSHPKQKVIEALIKLSQLGPQNVDKIADSICLTESNDSTTFPQISTENFNPSWNHATPVSYGQLAPPVNQISSNVTSNITPMVPGQVPPNLAQISTNVNQLSTPTNHSFIYQEFMSSSGTQPALNFNPMTQQFVAVPTVISPQMFCSPYVFQQQQQLHIVSTGTNMQPIVQKQSSEVIANTFPTIAASAPVTEVQNDRVMPPTESIAPENSDIQDDKSDKSETKSNHADDKDDFNNDDKDDFTNDDNEDKDGFASDDKEDDKEDENHECDDIDKDEIPLEEQLSLHSAHFDNGSIHCTDAVEIIPLNQTMDIHKTDEKPDTEQEVEIMKISFADETKVSSETIVPDVLVVEQEDDLNKACQTNQLEESAPETPEDKPDNCISMDTQTQNFETVDTKKVSMFFGVESDQQKVCVPINNIPNENITFLEIDSLNFILPNDFVQNGQSIISKVEDFECINDANQERPQVLMNIGIPKGHFEEGSSRKKELDRQEESMSQDSLNIHADERMPPRGELSEQESNGASDIAWGKTYQEGSSGMSTSYDLLARESWEASDCSDSEVPPLQSRVPPATCYSPDPDSEELMSISKKTPALTFSCTTCGETFSCPKERRVHQTQEHSSEIFPSKSKFTKSKLKVEIKEENNFEMFAKVETVVTESENIPKDTLLLQLDVKPAVRESVLCNVCGEMLTTMKELSAHLKNVHKIWSGQRHQCKTCFEEFPSDAKYTEHLRIHPLECTVCAKIFYRRVNFQMHMKRHWGVRPYKCETCSKAFLTKQKLMEHQNVHTGNTPFKCSMCDETFRRHSNLVQHRNFHHFNIKKKVKDYVCHCGEIFHSANKFTWHKETHDPKPKSCMYCQEKFVHMSSLTRHIRRAHNQRYVPDVRREAENVECHICKGVYLKSSLEIHLLTHSTSKQHACLICGKEFTTKWNLKLHRWTHASRTSKPFKCDLCNGAFIRHSDYISHMNSHKRVRPYTCNYCGCKFIRKSNCQRHVREHEEGKSYSCTVCNKSFHRSYYLKEHMRVHSGARPFACHICGKTSTTKSNHNKHMKIHHAREPVSTEG